MTNPFAVVAWSTAATTASWKLLLVLVSIAGVLVTVSYMRSARNHNWLGAVLFAALGTWFGTPLAVAWAQQPGQPAWMRNADSVEGLFALALGVCAPHLIGAVTELGRRFSADPTGFVSRKGGKE